MIALDRGRKLACLLALSAVVGPLGVGTASAQGLGQGLLRKGAASKPAPAPAAVPTPPPAGEGPMLKEVRVPVNTTDPIALVNGSSRP
jgi:hypothetical protein